MRALVDWPMARGANSVMWTLVHFSDTGDADGYVRYRLRDDWKGGLPAHQMFVEELVALTADAEASLWSALLDTDLVVSIEIPHFAVDDPLTVLLADQRMLHLTTHTDGIWIQVLDVEAALGARRYEVEDDLVIEVTGSGRLIVDAAVGRYRLQVSAAGVLCRRTDAVVDVTMGMAELGSLFLGGGDATRLAAAGRISGNTEGAVVRLHRLMLAHPQPNCVTGF